MTKVFFRVDSGSTIGGGHLLRCLTLANALKKLPDLQVYFVTRNHPGNLSGHIQKEGFEFKKLELTIVPNYLSGNYENWIGDSQENDAVLTDKYIQNLGGGKGDWLIVDHYGLDEKWEQYFTAKGLHVGVIDDLVNRRHRANFLIDQTCGRKHDEYQHLVSPSMKLFTGEEYCLLRPEFLRFRNASLSNRQAFVVPKQILVNFGSTDPHNHTARALIGITKFAVNHKTKVFAVIGSGCPHVENIRTVINNLPYECELLIDVQDMAKLMVDIDIAVGAAGATTWERCVLGIPTILLKTAENQSDVIRRVSDLGVAREYIAEPESQKLSDALEEILPDYKEISVMASQLIDGKGIDEIVKYFS